MYNKKTPVLHDENQKDILKGQKIIAAGILATRHLSDTDRIKDKIRNLIVRCVIEDIEGDVKENFRALEFLLGGASLGGVMLEKNTEIILSELKKFLSKNELVSQRGAFIENLFREEEGGERIQFLKGQKVKHSTENVSEMSYIKLKNDFPREKNIKNNERKDKIVSFINDKKSVVIKDITTLFPEVSEKTLQRELNKLIDEGRIIKRGNKRWSIYVAVNTLL